MSNYIDVNIGQVETCSDQSVIMIARTECTGRKAKKIKSKLGIDQSIPNMEYQFKNTSIQDIKNDGLKLNNADSSFINVLLKCIPSPADFATIISKSIVSGAFLQILFREHPDYCTASVIDEITAYQDAYSCYELIESKLSIKQAWQLYVENPFRTDEWLTEHLKKFKELLAKIIISNIYQNKHVFDGKEICLISDENIQSDIIQKMVEENTITDSLLDEVRNTVINKLEETINELTVAREKYSYIKDSLIANRTPSKYKETLYRWCNIRISELIEKIENYKAIQKACTNLFVLKNA